MTSPGQSEADLVRQAKDGDEAALQVLLRRHTPRLKGLLRSQAAPALWRKVSTADLLQEAFLTAHQRLSEFEDRGEGSFGHWLTRIVKHKLHDAIRHYAGTRKRGAVGEVSRGGRKDTRHFQGADPSPSQLAIAAEFRTSAEKAIEDLPPDYRTVVELRLREHLTIEETAEHMGRSKEATKKLYSRALARLAAAIGMEQHPRRGS